MTPNGIPVSMRFVGRTCLAHDLKADWSAVDARSGLMRQAVEMRVQGDPRGPVGPPYKMRDWLVSVFPASAVLTHGPFGPRRAT